MSRLAPELDLRLRYSLGMAAAAKLLRHPRRYLNRAVLSRELPRMWWCSRLALLFAPTGILNRLRYGPRSVALGPLRMNALQLAQTYIAWKVLRYCGLRSVDAGQSASLALAWNPATEYDLAGEQLERLGQAGLVLNARCTDIRKSTVGAHFQAVFGYRLEVDPLRYQGTLLRKSEANGRHDAVLMQGPLERADAGFVYQRVVTSSRPQGLAEWRVLIAGANVAAVYCLYQPPADRFTYFSVHAERVAPCQAFSTDELAGIARFCSQIGLDFGALDVLRDDADGRMYIADCNKTPTGPSEKLPLADQYRIVRDVARAFERAYLRTPERVGGRGPRGLGA